MSTDITQTKEYKRALKHHLKTNQPSSSAHLTPFRELEKKYKNRFPPPDLSEVLDAWALDDDLKRETELGGSWMPGGNRSGATVTPLLLPDGRRAYTIDSHPGLVLIPSYVNQEEQKALIQSSLTQQAKAPNETNLDTHYHIPGSGLWQAWINSCHRDPSDITLIVPRAEPTQESGFRPEPPPIKRTLIENTPGDKIIPNLEPLQPPPPSSSLSPSTPAQLLPKMRWANIGRSYHWGSKAYDFSKELAPFPEDVREICQRAVKAVPWYRVWSQVDDIEDDEWGSEGPDWVSWHDSYEPDAGIVNFYQTKDNLMGHVDRSEVSSTTPLVSISLGHAAIFLIGGATRDVKPTPILLRSGDVVIMSGPRCRRAFHGVPRILEGTLPDHLGEANGADWEPFATYLKTTRININVRQVFPRDYKPPKV